MATGSDKEIAAIDSSPSHETKIESTRKTSVLRNIIPIEGRESLRISFITGASPRAFCFAAMSPGIFNMNIRSCEICRA
jgi:hypothetical protein